MMNDLQNNSNRVKNDFQTSQRWLIVCRRILAVTSILLITSVFLDFTGTVSLLFGWMAKIQFLPALLALNIGVLIGLVILTLLLGRIYCSVICPLGIMQDGFAWIGKKVKKNRYSFSNAKSIMRYTVLLIMAIAIVTGISVMVAILAPYSAYGRIVTNLLQPAWIWGNNYLASIAESKGSFMFYDVDGKINSTFTLVIAVITLIVLAVLSWRNGRTYCNTVCPVGTFLSFISRYSLFKPVIDKSKCIGCRLCERNCKSACIDIRNKEIDYSRCVSCFDCIGKCNKGAIHYSSKRMVLLEGNASKVDSSRRQFLTMTTMVSASAAFSASEKFVDGGLAKIEDKAVPVRNTRIVPPGALSLRNLHNHCTACQLCVSECPNGVLRPSVDIEHLMQPYSSYETGYCRPECTRCSVVCPTGAIRPISREEKSSIQIGHAVWVKANCIPLTDGVECGNCARHCPVGAITIVETDEGVKIPAVNEERCIGCGACENLCPARPFSAIYVDGHENHRTI